MNEPLCLICGSTASRVRYRITRFRVVQCEACGQIYLDPIPTPEEIRVLFEQLYTTGDGSVPELKQYYGFCYEDSPDNPLVQQYEEWLDKIEAVRPPGRVLDVGCGTGLFLSVARRRGWEPFGIDESVEATRHAREHFGLEPWVGPFEDFSGQGVSFDLVTGWDVIEHSRQPVELLRCVRKSLAPDGIVALSTPNQRSILDLLAGFLYRSTRGRIIAPLEKFYIEQHFLYFTPNSLARCLERADLEITQLDREATDLRRLTLSLPTRLMLESLFLTARMLGRENRIFIIARATNEGGSRTPTRPTL